MKRVGFVLSDKKVKRLGFESDVKDLFLENGVEMIRIDLSRPVEDQGPFDLIIHKTSDLVVKAEFGNERARKELVTFSNYLKSHPSLPVMDSLDKILVLLNRFKVYKMVQDCNFEDGDLIFTPNFVEFTTSDVETNKRLLKQAGVQYPIVVKHTLAQSADIAHKMALVFNESGLADITPPCVAQTFINHNASLHKIYVLRERSFVVQRPSIKNLYPGDQETIFFDSQTISKTTSSCSLNQMDISELHESEQHSPDPAVMARLGHVIRRELQVDLIGIDVILDNQTGRYAVIDINSFPSYEGVPGFGDHLLAELSDVMDRSSNTSNNNSNIGNNASTSNGRRQNGFQNHVKTSGRGQSLCHCQTVDLSWTQEDQECALGCYQAS